MAKKTENVVPEELRESANKIWLAGLGAVAMAEEEGSKFFRNLVKKGETFENRGKKRMQKVQDDVEDRVQDAKEFAGSTWSRLGASFDEKVAGTLKRLGVPTRMEIQKLTKRVIRAAARNDPSASLLRQCESTV